MCSYVGAILHELTDKINTELHLYGCKEVLRLDLNYERRLGQNIRRLRMERKLSQEEVAAKLQLRGCDITRSAVAKIEAGCRHIYSDEIKLIKEILKVSFDELFVEYDHN